MSGRAVDVSRWNLFVAASRAVPVALIAACGPVVANEDPDSNSGSDDTDPTLPTGPTEDSATSSDDETSTPECVSNGDCPYGYSCFDGICEYDCFCGCGIAPPPPGFELRCSPPQECYDDEQCGEAEMCRYGYCEPSVPDCGDVGLPVLEATIDLTFSGESGVIVGLAPIEFAATPGTEIAVARGTQVEVVAQGQGTVVATADGVLTAIATGDVDGNGEADIVTATDAAVTVWFVQDGVVSPSGVMQPAVGVSALALGDEDGDGLVDIFAHAGGTISVFHNVGGIAIATGQLLVSDGVGAFTAVDTDGDGRSDAVWTGDGSVSLQVADVLQSLGGFDPFEDVDVVAADFDGDGTVDLAAVGREPSAMASVIGPIWVGSVHTALLDAAPISGAAGDVDGDGRADLAIGLNGVGAVRVRFGSVPEPVDVGTSEPFGCATDYDAGIATGHVVVADVDGNGFGDLVVSDGAVARVLSIGI